MSVIEKRDEVNAALLQDEQLLPLEGGTKSLTSKSLPLATALTEPSSQEIAPPLAFRDLNVDLHPETPPLAAEFLGDIERAQTKVREYVVPKLIGDEFAPEERLAKLGVKGMCLTLDQRIVLDDIFFEVKSGEMLGIFGPKGAGKTALVRAITGFVKPDRGTIWLDGKSLTPHDRALRRKLGVVFEKSNLDPRLSTAENLLCAAALFGIYGREAKERTRDLLAFMELDPKGHEQISRLSRGAERRLALARALIHKPEIMILDEPTHGLPLNVGLKVWQRLLALRRLQEITLLLCTSDPLEAAKCDRLLVIDRGHIVALDTPKNLLSRIDGDVLSLEPGAPEELPELVDTLREEMDIVARVARGRVIFEKEHGHNFIPYLVESFPTGLFKTISVHQATLADAFFKLTGRPLLSDDDEEVENWQ